MKRLFLSLVLALVTCGWAMADCKSFFDVTQDSAEATVLANKQADAKALKVAGDKLAAQGEYAKAAAKYETAADEHPVSAVAAMYYWKSACATVGHLNKSHDWVINTTVSDLQKTAGLALLKKADDKLANPDGYCHKGVDEDTLKELIGKVRDCINGNCQ